MDGHTHNKRNRGFVLVFYMTTSETENELKEKGSFAAKKKSDNGPKQQ